VERFSNLAWRAGFGTTLKLAGERLELRGRLDAQLAGEEPLQLLVLLQRCGGLTVENQQADHMIVAFLPQGVCGHGPPGELEGAVQVAGLLVMADQLLQELEIGLRQPLPFGNDPAFEVAGKQLASIPIRCLGEASKSLDRGVGRRAGKRTRIRHFCG
jgi:hypothetical protein